MTSFRAPEVKRGRITNFRTGRFLTFVYNPPSIDEAKGSNLVIDPIPGDGDPLVRWASGGPNTIDMDLNIDGDGRRRRTGVQLFNGAKGLNELPLDEADQTFSIAGEIEFFEQFQYPVNPEVRGGTGEPDLLVFTMGRRYQGVVCIVSNITIKIIEFDTDLNPSKAQVQLSLVRRYAESRFSGSVWDIPEGLGLEQQATPAFPSGLTNAEGNNQQ